LLIKLWCGRVNLKQWIFIIKSKKMKTKDFYFHISNTGVRDFVTAYSFVDAQARAWRQYPDDINRIVWEDPADPVPDVPNPAPLAA